MLLGDSTASVAVSNAGSDAAADAAAAADGGAAQRSGAAEICARQRIHTSHASRNPAKGLLCQPPTVQSIHYYEPAGDGSAYGSAISIPYTLAHPYFCATQATLKFTIDGGTL